MSLIKMYAYKMYNKGIKLKTINKLHHDFIYVRTICAKIDTVNSKKMAHQK